MSGGTWTSSAAGRLARSSTDDLLYGAIVTAAVLVAAGGHLASAGRVLAVWAVVLCTYWLTHVYVHAARGQFHGDTRNLLRRAGDAAKSEVAIVEGGVPAMLVFLTATAFGFATITAVHVALWFTVVLLGLAGYLGARHAGRSSAASVGEAAGAALLGVLMVAAKTLLH